MMADVSLYKQIDAVFFFIKKKTALGASVNDNYIWNLYIERTPELGIGKQLFYDILQNLLDNGYITISSDGAYHLTVKGRAYKGFQRTNHWFLGLSRKTIVEGTIGALLTALIIWIISMVYSSWPAFSTATLVHRKEGVSTSNTKPKDTTGFLSHRQPSAPLTSSIVPTPEKVKDTNVYVSRNEIDKQTQRKQVRKMPNLASLDNTKELTVYLVDLINVIVESGKRDFLDCKGRLRSSADYADEPDTYFTKIESGFDCFIYEESKKISFELSHCFVKNQDILYENLLNNENIVFNTEHFSQVAAGDWAPYAEAAFVSGKITVKIKSMRIKSDEGCYEFRVSIEKQKNISTR
jgi:hypothetical protein